MALDRVESLRAYRATLQRRFDQMAHAALEGVPGGEWDGMDVLRRAELERIIHDFAEADPEPVATTTEVRTPAMVFVDAVCPECGIPARLLVTVSTELVVSTEGKEIRAKAKSKPMSHVCGQLPLDASGATDDDQMHLSDLVGPTQPTLVIRSEMPRPDDVTLDRPIDERCGAEEVIPGEDGDETLVCERLIDHDAPENASLPDARLHWAEGNIGWSTEERPIPAGITNEPDQADDDEEDEG